MPRTKGGKQSNAEHAKIATLTAHEREVITLVGEGLRNHQIARHLALSETTVRHHLTVIFRKLGVRDRLELVIYTYQHGLALFDPHKHPVDRSYIDPELGGLLYTAHSLWHLGYPDQALQRSHRALILARELSYPHSLAFALNLSATVHYFRGESQAAQERAEAAIALCSEQGFLQWLAHGTILRGWALTEQRREGIAQIRQGLATWRAIGAELAETFFLAMLAEACGKGGQSEEGLSVVAEALAQVDKTGERFYKAELHRLQGELVLQSGVRSPESKPSNPHSAFHIPQLEAEAEACFHKAIAVARKQQAKSLELRAVMSLSRLWQRQGKKNEARQPLAEVYGWFTEGFETKDLQEAKALLDELA